MSLSGPSGPTPTVLSNGRRVAHYAESRAVASNGGGNRWELVNESLFTEAHVDGVSVLSGDESIYVGPEQGSVLTGFRETIATRNFDATPKRAALEELRRCRKVAMHDTH